MAEKFKVDSKVIKDRIKKMGKIKEKYEKEVVKPLTHLKDEMKGIWEGDSCNAYSKSMDKYKKAFDSVVEILDGAIIQMDNTMDYFEVVDKKLASGLKSSKK